MNVVFYHFAEVLPPYLDTCVASVRQHMPHARIIHLTDMETPPCPGVDDVRRFASPIVTRPVNKETVCFAGCYCLAKCGLEEMLFIEPDMLIVDDLSPLALDDYDITLASRPKKDRVQESYRRLYPYNSFILAKTPAFWTDLYARMSRYRRMHWARNMEAVGDIVNSWRKYRVHILDGDIYNARPRRYTPDAKVYHFRIGDLKNTVMPAFYAKYIEGRNG